MRVVQFLNVKDLPRLFLEGPIHRNYNLWQKHFKCNSKKRDYFLKKSFTGLWEDCVKIYFLKILWRETHCPLDPPKTFQRFIIDFHFYLLLFNFLHVIHLCLLKLGWFFPFKLFSHFDTEGSLRQVLHHCNNYSVILYHFLLLIFMALSFPNMNGIMIVCFLVLLKKSSSQFQFQLLWTAWKQFFAWDGKAAFRAVELYGRNVKTESFPERISPLVKWKTCILHYFKWSTVLHYYSVGERLWLPKRMQWKRNGFTSTFLFAY